MFLKTYVVLLELKSKPKMPPSKTAPQGKVVHIEEALEYKRDFST